MQKRMQAINIMNQAIINQARSLTENLRLLAFEEQVNNQKYEDYPLYNPIKEFDSESMKSLIEQRRSQLRMKPIVQ